MRKKLCILISVLISCIILMENAIAYESYNDIQSVNKYYYPLIDNYSNDIIVNKSGIQARVPNAIPITMIARKDGTGVDVKVGNVGVDALDKVTVTVTATGHAKSKTKTASVPSVVGKKFSFYMPMLKCKTTYSAVIRIVDGSGNSVKKAKAVLTYSEDYLKKIKWNKGTFGTRGSSLDYHFAKHAQEVGSVSVVDYINKATNYRSQIINDLKNNKLYNYIISVPRMSIQSKKFKNKKDRRFAILSDSGQELLSFGK